MKKRTGAAGIIPIKNLFNKYKNTLKAPQKTVELETIRVVGEILSYTLKEEQVVYTVSSRILNINVPSILKQEILLHKKKLLSELSKRLGKASSPVELL